MLQFCPGSNIKSKSVILMLFVMPMWINFSLRITALKEVLTVLEGNLAMHPFLNAVIGMTYDFLPFMILPIYTTISRMDKALREAAMDLGANECETFLKITLPLSVPGIISGVSMVFLPAMTNYVVLDMLYNSTYINEKIYQRNVSWACTAVPLPADFYPGSIQLYRRHQYRRNQGLLPS